jgi:hypothetical protein
MFVISATSGFNATTNNENNNCININNDSTVDNDTTTRTVNLNPATKKRYFDSPVVATDSECTNTAPSSSIEDELRGQALADTSASGDNEALLGQRCVEDFMSHCHQLWASCQVESVCCCIYRCLHIESELLPFCFLQNDFAAFPHHLLGFANGVKEQRDVNVLYASVVHLLVTGDCIGHHLLGGGGRDAH